MNQRKIHTKIWRDAWFQELSPTSKLLFLYLISNSHMGLSGFVELSNKTILFETGLNTADLEYAKTELKEKVVFDNGWVFVKNLLKYDPIRGESNTLQKTLNKELIDVPVFMRKYADGSSMGDRWVTDGRIGKGIGNGIGKGKVLSKSTLTNTPEYKKLMESLPSRRYTAVN